jgi:hypothetical protein
MKKANRSKNHLTILNFLFVILLITISCAKKAVIEERDEKPVFLYEIYEHGVNPISSSLEIFRDGYIIFQSTEIYSEEQKKKAEYISEIQIENLRDIFLEEDFLKIQPLSMPAVYGGIIITITFSYDDESNTIKFLQGTKIPLSVDKCWEEIGKIAAPFFE